MRGQLVPYNKTIVCLANSYKPPNGRCISRREVMADGYGDWIRPVSDRETAEVAFSEYRYENYHRQNKACRVEPLVDCPLAPR